MAENCLNSFYSFLKFLQEIFKIRMSSKGVCAMDWEGQLSNDAFCNIFQRATYNNLIYKLAQLKMIG